MVQFLFNNEMVRSDLPEGLTLLDFVRYHQQLKATKIGCREGDCGACTILIGELHGESVQYRAITSCITPLANAHGKHVVTLEGLNLDGLTPVQEAMVQNSATQCGFCTPGFVSSLTAYCLSNATPDYEGAIAAIDGNICRCTGYKSIQRAAKQLVNTLESKSMDQEPVSWCVDNEFVPQYFTDVQQRLSQIPKKILTAATIVGGGTDLYVQKHHHMEALPQVENVSQNEALRYIEFRNGYCHIGAASVATDLKESELIASRMPQLVSALKWISSTQIRNIGTIAGNFVNASPIGDFSSMFLALNASLVIANRANQQRICKLKDFFIDYKKIDLGADEFITEIFFKMPVGSFQFNFEKVCKRKYLDIASVNTSFYIELDESNQILELAISAGGVAPIPKLLSELTNLSQAQVLTPKLVHQILEMMDDLVAPISDIRGSAAYKRLLLKQLIKAHFITCFPHLIKAEDLL